MLQLLGGSGCSVALCVHREDFSQRKTLGSNLTRTCHNLTRTCHNLTRTCHNLTRTCHNLTRTCHNLTRTCHNLIRTCHNLTRTCHNLTRTCHILTRTCHNLTLNGNPELYPKVMQFGSLAFMLTGLLVWVLPVDRLSIWWVLLLLKVTQTLKYKPIKTFWLQLTPNLSVWWILLIPGFVWLGKRGV
jgi:hypothetical protein